MDKFNLLDADDFFSQLGSEKEEKKEQPEKEETPEKKKPETPDEPEKPEIADETEEPEDLIISVDNETDETDLGVIEDTETKTETAPPEEPEDVSVEILEDEPEIDAPPEVSEEPAEAEEEIQEESEITEETTDKTKAAFIDDYYEEAQQEKVNIKPVLIVVGIVVILAIIGFALWSVFSGGKEEPPKPVVEKVKKPSPEELRRLNFLSDNANKNAVNLATISEIMNLNTPKTKITSVYLYGEEFIFEVFCPSRDVLGKFNMDIKSKYPNGHFNLQTSQVRPGTKGGIFGVYTVSIANGAASRDSTVNFKSENEFESWFSSQISQGGLKLIGLKNINSFTANGFRVIQYEATANGDFQSCYNLINTLKAQRRNIDFYKITINARNLKNFSSKAYKLSFIIRLYL